jgi:hypothetical protein
VVTFDEAVASIDVSFAWKADDSQDGTTEDALVEFYLNGVLVGSTTDVGGSDGVDPVVRLKPDNGSTFDKVVFSAPNAYDDYLINSITYNNVADIVTDEGVDVPLNISSALVDTDGSESLALEMRDIPVGATISDGTNSFTATSGNTTLDIINWNLDTMTFNMPNIDVSSTVYTLNVVATTTEYSNGDTASTSLPITITVLDVNHSPVAVDTTVRVSEEGLVDGIADTNGENAGDDTTDLTVVTGSIATDADGDTMDITLSEPTQTLTSNGVTITWNGVGTDTLIGSANGVDILKVNVTNTGDYTVTLLGPVDHPNNSVEDALSLDMNVDISDGINTTSANLNVIIEDDMAISGDVIQDIVIPEQNTNLMFTIDTSGSMGSSVDDGNGGSVERMEMVLNSVRDVINSYHDIGNVKVQITTFDSGSDSTHQINWFTVSDALDFIGDGTSGSRNDTLDPSGGTDYDQGLLEAKLGWESDGKIPDSAGNVANIMYFLSDGQPQTAGGTEDSDGITGVEITEWTDYVTAQGINAFAVGVGSGLDDGDRVYLDPIAYDGATNTEKLGVIVTDETALASTLLGTVQAPLVGNVLGQLGSDGFGADGGFFQDVTIDGVTYTYNKANDEITSSNGTIAGSQLELDTAQNGHISLNFVSGEYVYQPDVHLAQGETKAEVFDFTAVDNDGDASTGTVTLNVSREAKVSPILTADNADVYEAAMDEGTQSDLTTEIATGNIFANDTLPDLITLTDVSIVGGVTDTSVAGEITVTTAQGNTLVVNTDTGDYTYTLLNALDHLNELTLETNTFDGNSKDGWSLSEDLDNKNNRLHIDGNGDTATKTFDFGSTYAGKTVQISFDMETNSKWDDNSDAVIVNSNNDGDIINDQYGADTSHSYTNIPVTLDANGQVTLTITADSNNNKEDLFIDNFVVMYPEPIESVVDDFTYKVTDIDGIEYSSNLDVTIHDDAPIAMPQDINLVVEPIDTNLSFILDMSSSMDNDERQLTKDAINLLVSKYEEFGNVHLKIVEFWGDNNSDTGWQDSTYDYNYVTGTSGTDIEQGLHQMVDTYNTGKPEADQELMYFFGDGDTYDAYEDDFNAYLPTWNNFVTSGTIDKLFSYSINSTDVLRDIGVLADNGENVVSQDAVVIADINDLSAAVSTTAVEYVEGNLTADINGTALIDFGADGGHIESITIGANTATYDENNPLQTISGDHGDFEINFDTGAYRYIPTDTVDATETIEASVVDKDGDALDAILVNVNVEHAVVHTFDNSAALDAGDGFDIVVLDSGLNLDFNDANLESIANIEKINLTENGDHTINNLSLDDVLNMTDTDNELIIEGSLTDNVDTVNKDGWTKDTTHVDSNTSDGLNEYVYDNGAGDSITLKVDEQIDSTGL